MLDGLPEQRKSVSQVEGVGSESLGGDYPRLTCDSELGPAKLLDQGRAVAAEGEKLIGTEDTAFNRIA